MNVFFLSEEPEKCAIEHVDKHVVKMNVEYAQLLSTAHRVLDGTYWEGRSTTGRKVSRFFLEEGELNQKLYLAAHINHPSAKWVRKSKANYDWLYKLWMSLGREFTYRYGKMHKSIQDLQIYLIDAPANISDGPFTEPPPAMTQFPECIVPGDSIKSYRNYYWTAKKDFAVWTKRDKPTWWQDYERKGQQEASNGNIPV